eukprot:sb/3464036/
MRLPDEKRLADYYKKTKTPLSLCGKILTVEELFADLELLCDNSTSYYKKTSPFHKDAVSLKEVIISIEKNFKPAPKLEPPPTPKVGEKRKAGARVPTPSGGEKEGKKSKQTDETRVKKAVLKEWNNLLSCGGNITEAIIPTYNEFYTDINSFPELQSVLESSTDRRNILLKVIAALSSRLAVSGPLSDVGGALVKINPDTQTLFEAVPQYTVGEEYYMERTELLSVFKHTAYSTILTTNTSIERLEREEGFIESIPGPVVLMSAEGIQKCIRGPILDKLKLPKSKTPKKETIKKETIKTVQASTTAVIPKGGVIDTKPAPKSATPKTPKVGTATPKSGTPKSNSTPKRKRVKAEIMIEDIKTDSVPPAVLEEAKIFLKKIRNMKDDQGRLMFIEFFGIPLESSYHRVIKYPMSLDVIEQQLEEGVMRCIDDVVSALLLIIENAREYNEEGSPLYNKALKLQKELLCAAPVETMEPMIHTHRYGGWGFRRDSGDILNRDEVSYQ